MMYPIRVFDSVVQCGLGPYRDMCHRGIKFRHKHLD